MLIKQEAPAPPFELPDDQGGRVTLADTEHTVAEAFGAWGRKQRAGRTYHGIIRSTFLIDGKGVVRRVWSPVTVKGHAEEVLRAIIERDT